MRNITDGVSSYALFILCTNMFFDTRRRRRQFIEYRSIKLKENRFDRSCSFDVHQKVLPLTFVDPLN